MTALLLRDLKQVVVSFTKGAQNAHRPFVSANLLLAFTSERCGEHFTDASLYVVS